MQIELALQVGQFQGAGFFEADPHKVARFGSPGRAFVKGDISNFFSGAVNGGRDNSTHGADHFVLGGQMLGSLA
jgi:hypothetical protein